MRRKPLFLLLLAGFALSGMLSGFLMNYMKTGQNNISSVPVDTTISSTTNTEIPARPQTISIPVLAQVIESNADEAPTTEEANPESPNASQPVEIPSDGAASDQIAQAPTQNPSDYSEWVEIPLTGGKSSNIFAQLFSMVAKPKQSKLAKQEKALSTWQTIVFETTLAFGAGVILIILVNIIYKIQHCRNKISRH